MASSATSIPAPSPLKLGGDIAADWERFRCEWENYEIAADLEEVSEKKRAAMLLACVGSSAHALFRTFKFEDDADKAKVDKILDAFEKHCVGEANVTYERYMFHQRVQQPGEPFEDFLADLRKMARTCEFEQLEDSLVRDRVVIGIRDEPTRRRLLQSKKLALSEAIEVCKASEATSRRLRAMSGAAEVEALHSSSSSSRGRQSASKPRDRDTNREASSGRRCRYCDRQHENKKESCPAYKKRCKKCQRLHHFAKVCRSSSASTGRYGQQKEVCQIDGDDTEELLALHTADTKRAYCNLNVDGRSVHFLLDCGATVNVLPLEDASAINPKLTALRPAETRLTMFDNTELKTVGVLNAVLQHPKSGKQRRMLFYVAAQHNRAILGMEACVEMNLIHVNYDNICAIERQAAGPRVSSAAIGSSNALQRTSLPSPLTKQSIVERYADLFKGVGLLEGDVHLEVDPTIPPVQLPPRRLPVPVKDIVKRELDAMVKEGIIEPVNTPSSWISALLVVRKPNGNVRICIDPQKLNKALKRVNYPMPTIEDVLPKLAKAKVFSTLDAKHGFWHLKLDEASRELTTFETPFGRYRWIRLPFGVSPAAEIFQSRIHAALAGLDGVACIADDILVYGCGETVAEADIDHDINMIKLLDRCKEKNLHINLEKLQLRRPSTTFMGHELTKDGLKPDRRKIAAMVDMPAPTDRQGVMRLLGMVTYLAKFLPNFSEVTAPLRELLANDNDFRWDDDRHGKALRQLKSMLVSAPILSYYDVSKPVVVQCDASSMGLGAALLQDGKVVEYASRALTHTERESYAQIEKEMLAVVFSLQRFDTYVYSKHVTVESDHKPLMTIVKKALTAAPKRLQRMLLRLQRYNYTIVYRPGSQMHIADTLSRAYLIADTTANDFPEEVAHLAEEEQREALKMVASSATIELIKSAAAADEQYQLLRRQIAVGWPDSQADIPADIREFATFADELAECDELIYKGQRVVVPRGARAEILTRIHASHIGINGCIRRAQEAVFYPGLTADIKKVVSECAICQAVQQANSKEPLMSHATPSRPWEKVGVDLFAFRGRDYLITVDYLSGYFEIDRLPSKRATDVIYCLKSHFSRHGLPMEVCSDNNPFNSSEFRCFAAKYDFKITLSSPHFAQSNGRVENAVKTARRLMEKATSDREDPFLALLAWRNTPAEQLGPSPAQIMFGRRTRTHLPATSSLLASPHDAIAHDELVAAKARQAAYYNRGAHERPPLAVGDTVRTRWDKGDEWRKARVVEVLPHRSYNVQFDDGSTRRRTSKHVRFTREPPLIIRDELDTPSTAARPRPAPRDDTVAAGGARPKKPAGGHGSLRRGWSTRPSLRARAVRLYDLLNLTTSLRVNCAVARY